MDVFTEDGKRSVAVGSSEIMFSVYSTVITLLKRNNKINDAVMFLKTGTCSWQKALETARQINLIRDGLAGYAPEKAVWNCENRKMVAPWKNNLCPVITSCANLYTTADGKDLLYELVVILTYSGLAKKNVLWG